MRKFRVVAASGAALLAQGCAATGITSPYAFPEEGVAYRYGAFCGPGNPVRVSEDPAVQMEALDALTPVDHVDAVCREHDRCYERHGRDHPGCDYAMVGALRFYLDQSLTAGGGLLPSRAEQACMNLSAEIMTPFSTKYLFGTPILDRAARAGGRSEGEASGMLAGAYYAYAFLAAAAGDEESGAADEDAPANAHVQGLAESIAAAGLTGLSRQFSGFPDAPGACNAATIPALSHSFACHFDYFEREIEAASGDVEAVSLARMPSNGCAQGAPLGPAAE